MPPTPKFWAEALNSTKPLMELRQLLEQHEDRMKSDSLKGQSLFVFAASLGRDDVVQEMLNMKNGHDWIHDVNESGLGALHYAADYGWLDIAVELIQRGADPNQKGMLGNVPLDFAIHIGDQEMVEFLMPYTQIEKDPKLGRWLLQSALMVTQLPVIKRLVEHGAKVNEKNEMGTALETAISLKVSEEVIAYLKEVSLMELERSVLDVLTTGGISVEGSIAAPSESLHAKRL